MLLGLLVLAHEWGHFVVARRLGVRVEEFAFGFPPRLWSTVRRETRYALNLFPFGGYVRLFGESGGRSDDPASFGSRPVRQRLAIIVAGVAMNLIVAWLLFSLGHGLGLPTVLDEAESATEARVTIIAVAPGSPADAAGLRFGDTIQRVTGDGGQVMVTRIEDVQEFIAAHRGAGARLVVLRGKETVEIGAVPRLDPPPGQGPLGIAMARVGIVRSPLWRAPWDGLKTTANAFLAIARALWNLAADLVAGQPVAPDISGPVGIFAFANEARRLGLVYLVELAGILSVNLAFLNLLPVPGLDGGRIFFLAIERARGGSRVSERLEQAIHTIGFAILLALMAAVTYRDIARVF